ncbi:MAG TPA: hypothetical protein VLH38_04050 [Patescibacteria group bacterium]|nr:hypothetical protein [Patescibacteria group bacterium]
MFGHDDNEQMTQDTAAQGVMPDSTVVTASAPVGGDLPAPVVDETAAVAPTTFAPSEDTVAAPTVGEQTADPTTTAPTIDDSDDLLQIKQQALQQLSPLVGHLEQSPEEKFRTTMMMIQASDNKDLIKDAYAAAQQIEDEKMRAQALLDIVNEINYFTQQQA